MKYSTTLEIQLKLVKETLMIQAGLISLPGLDLPKDIEIPRKSKRKFRKMWRKIAKNSTKTFKQNVGYKTDIIGTYPNGIVRKERRRAISKLFSELSYKHCLK